MAYFEPSIDADGIHIPTYDDVLENLITEYKNIFGEDVYLGVETPDYQLLSMFAKHLDDMYAICVDAYNARNPDYATGNSLDLLLPLNGMSRKQATYSTVTLKLTGDVGATIPAGSKAIDDDGYIWDTDEDLTIPDDGYGTVGATCETAGAIAAPIGAINMIYTPVSGWSIVTNEEAAEMGINVETDAEVRARRNLLLTTGANGTLDAIIRALVNVSEVEFVSLNANDTGSTDANGIPAHSICAVVKGGEKEDIAEAIYKNKAPGVATYGNTTQNYLDPTGHTIPIKFSRPTDVTTSVAITIQSLPGYDEDRVLPTIKGAIMSEINALGIGKNWGVTMAYKDIYNAFGNDCPFIITAVSGSNTHGTSTTEVTCAYNEVLVTDEEHISITVNS